MIKIKRAYEKAEPADGKRILIDRLWPRGVNKEEARIDEWYKELAPSDELRKWFGHNPDRWEEFQERYKRELASPERQRMLDEIAREAGRATVTLVYAAKDTEHSNAKMLEGIVSRRLAKVHG